MPMIRLTTETMNLIRRQAHSVRGFMFGALKRQLELDVVSEKNENLGEFRYYIAALKSE